MNFSRPMFSSLSRKEADSLIRFYARNLKGTIVDRKGTMPIGVSAMVIELCEIAAAVFRPHFRLDQKTFFRISLERISQADRTYQRLSETHTSRIKSNLLKMPSKHGPR